MKNTLLNIWNFYLEGFRSMTLGRTLWLIILVKLFIMFFILKIFFFPHLLKQILGAYYFASVLSQDPKYRKFQWS